MKCIHLKTDRPFWYIELEKCDICNNIISYEFSERQQCLDIINRTIKTTEDKWLASALKAITKLLW